MSDACLHGHPFTPENTRVKERDGRKWRICLACQRGRKRGTIKPLSGQERFFMKVHYEPNSGCWIWLGQVDSLGYGRFRGGITSRLAHRWAYEAMRELIPSGVECDHLCRVRCCVNPAHLELVTHTINMQRADLRNVSIVAKARFQSQTHCKRGHEFTSRNTRIIRHRDGRTQRHCRLCQNITAQIWRHTQRKEHAHAAH